MAYDLHSDNSSTFIDVPTSLNALFSRLRLQDFSSLKLWLTCHVVLILDARLPTWIKAG